MSNEFVCLESGSYYICSVEIEAFIAVRVPKVNPWIVSSVCALCN